MRPHRITPIIFVIVAMYGICCAIALGQSVTANPPIPVPSATRAYPAASAVRPAPAAPTAAAVMQQAGGSLMKAAAVPVAPEATQARLQAVSFFAVPVPEPKTLKKHDLVTIIVREESEFSSTGTTDLKKQEAIDAKLENFIRLNFASLASGPHVTGDAIGSQPLEAKGSVDSSFKGEGSVDRSDSFTGRITAEILDVKPNGTLIVQARKRIKTDEEEQTFQLTGTCRAEDVQPDNTVLSTQVYDLELTKTHKGAVRDATKRGWIPRLLDALNPF
jgi:flagellar L-ring protein precursor FlgH